ncbi:AMP-binding protein [Nocardiopsis suaedae]|uniref:AMP-binding protein n=1 Tax=Nocardiopsis suaedae TaxID=3018444 RepID=A0ABT4TTP3_9ACTN|nr:AMP-binding protein [Nocardiopsis suaedae]MDA2808065.1 AMP-binding protein [Nocardiopsis suaedae]
MLRGRARRTPGAVLLAADGEWLTAEDLAARARRIGRALIASGVRPGDRVALMAPNSPAWGAAAFGVWEAGAVLVPLSTRYKGLEAGGLLRRTGARVLMCAERFRDTPSTGAIGRAEGRPEGGRPFAGLPGLAEAVLLDVEPGGPEARREGTVAFAAFLDRAGAVPEAAAEERALGAGGGDLAEVLATSGTTGEPKGVMIPHGQLLRGYWDWASVVGLDGEDRYPVIAPFSHGFGVNAGLLAGVMRGARLLPQAVFDPGGLAGLIADEGATVLAGPPTLFQGLLARRAAGERFPALRVGICGAASVPPELVRRLLDEGVVRRMVNAYGLIEGTVVSMTREGDPVEVVAGSAGRPMPGVQVEVVDEKGGPLPPGARGEILVGGSGVMDGYWGDPGRTAEAVDGRGRLRTGDVGVMSERGDLSVVDRKKDVFTVGGFSAYPAEIEALLVRCPLVAAAAVLPVPDERLGEVGCAFVVPADGGAGASAADTASEVTAWARENMANYKVPRRVVAVESLPVSANGKTDKAALARRLADGRER